MNHQLMPHTEHDVKCEKKYWLKVLALNQNHFGKFFLLFLKNPNDFCFLCSSYFPPYEEKSMIIACPLFKNFSVKFSFPAWNLMKKTSL